MPKIIQKILHYFARKAMVERIGTGKYGFFFRRMYADHEDRYKFAIPYVTDKAVLDMACGEGYGTASLSLKAKSVIGVDIANEVINDAKKKYTLGKSNNIRFICSDAIEYLEHNDTVFDVIISYETVEHVKDYLLFLTLIKKNLKNGGTLILSTPNKQFSDLLMGGTFNPYHNREFYPQELVDALGDIFGHEPQVFYQRPIDKHDWLWSSVKSFLLSEKSSIVRETSQITGLETIFVSVAPSEV